MTPAKMDQRNKSIIIGLVTVILIGGILGGAYYLGKTYKNQQTSSSESEALRSLSQNRTLPTISLSPSPVVNILGTNSLSPAVDTPSTKTYLGNNFKINYPKNWGLLTCSNSRNFELDPVNPADTKNVVCGLALKPVTVIINTSRVCSGDKVKIGNYQVIKSVGIDGNGVTVYHWCFNLAGGTKLDISHRVDQKGSRATSKEDFSTSVEQIISNVQSSAGS